MMAPNRSRATYTTLCMAGSINSSLNHGLMKADFKISFKNELPVFQSRTAGFSKASDGGMQFAILQETNLYWGGKRRAMPLLDQVRQSGVFCEYAVPAALCQPVHDMANTATPHFNLVNPPDSHG